MDGRANEQSPLLGNGDNEDRGELIELKESDPDHPRSWKGWRKMSNIAIIALMSLLSPLASSMFAPGIKQMAESLNTTETAVIACQTSYIIMLGTGPLILAPLSELFGRRMIYISCFSVFALLQIPTALAPNITFLLIMRALTGFVGSASIANGGGTISDMFTAENRAGIFGWYLLGPLLGPTLGPLLGGAIMQGLDWRWIFWVLAIISAVNVAAGVLFLRETYPPALLAARKRARAREHPGKRFYYAGEEDDELPLTTRLRRSVVRPLRILFTQPIVMSMAAYQALIFATTYSLYTRFESIYGAAPPAGYGFSTLQVGLLYFGPGLGFLVAVWFVVPRIDTLYVYLCRTKMSEGKPEFKLPLANIGSVLIPAGLFWFAWSVETHCHWFVTVLPTFFYGIGQVAVFNSTQNYYIDAFEKYAASAIAAGALFRSLMGGLVPLFTPALIDKVGVGWGLSVFGFLSIAMAPLPVVFYYYGELLREKYAIEL